MKSTVLALGCLALASTATAAPAGNPQVEAPIHQFMDAFNKGDMKTAAAAHLPSVTIIDEPRPHLWQGPTAFMSWATDLTNDDKADGVSGESVAMGALKREVVSGDNAYVIMAATYKFTKKGVAMHEPSQMTFALKKTAAGWKIAAWTWTGPEPTPAK